MINRILIVGLGSIGKRHLRLARKLFPKADIRILHHQPSTLIPEYSDGCFFTIKQAVEFSPHIALIANPAPFHLAAAQILAGLGAHLLVEKPLAVSVNGVVKLLELIREQGTILLIGYNLRFIPSLQKFRDLILEKEIGKVWSVRCEIGQFLPSWRPDTDYRQNVSARSELGGGALLELSHEIDYLTWIFGEVEHVKATTSRQSNLQIDVEDTAHLILGFIPENDGHQLIGTLNMDFIRQDATRLCTAIGECGSLRWNGLNGTVEKFESGAKDWVELFRDQHQRDESYIAEWRHFQACINEQQKPLISGEDGLNVLRIIEAARLASQTGGQIKIITIPTPTKGDA